MPKQTIDSIMNYMKYNKWSDENGYNKVGSDKNVPCPKGIGQPYFRQVS